ncbi:MAG TPA: LPS export ABC transporter periplasmic protein LptC [Bryobacteraceae bacterium]|jgi:lipopolysaccharide export system protein LptA|nr:LPS export ABC transporter periplasmic protein LptC [Bryobacteraceae bacterium]
MRSLRWLLLAALVLVAAAVLGTYNSQRRQQRSSRRAAPPAIGLNTKTEAQEWEWEQGGGQKVHITAKSMTQSKDGDKAELKDIELRIYQKDGEHYDRIKSPGAQFSTSDNKLYSPEEAEITLDIPTTGEPSHPLTSIRTWAINFDSKTGQAFSDQHVSFTFANGEGTCTGASYDPATHALTLNRNVILNLHGKGPASLPMKVESEQLKWDETSSVLQLSPWSKLTRAETVIEAGASTIHMKDKLLNSIDAPNGHGTDKRPGRDIQYSADMIHVDYNDDGEMDKMSGTGNAKLTSHAPGSATTVSGNRVDMAFNQENGESVLSTVVATGKGLVESKPVPDPKGDTADTKVLTADTLDLHMRPGGKEIDHINTQAPGTLEFLPNQPTRHRRLLKADRMAIAYADKNEIESFHATNGATQTWPTDEEVKKKTANAAMAFTSSKIIDASFDGHGQLKLMKQQDDFHYTGGARKAQSKNAVLENDRNVMTLETGARIADDTGSTTADNIQINQNTGDFDAKGHAYTTRLPDPKGNDPKKKAGSAMLDDDQPTQGTADRITSGERNRLIHYTGNAVVWQTSNRIQADRIDIDREKKSVVADGRVVTELQDDTKKAAAAKDPKPAPAQPIFTVVRAPHMVYTDTDHLALYSGGVDFVRPNLTVKSASLKAYLNEKDSGKDSRVNRALGDGAVQIVEVSPIRQRIGKGEHAEYYTDDNKVILTGGSPQLADTIRGNTRGDKLTYFTDDERLLVDGVPERQVQSHYRKKL